MPARPRGITATDAARDLLGAKILKTERLGRHLPFLSALRDDVILTR